MKEPMGDFGHGRLRESWRISEVQQPMIPAVAEMTRQNPGTISLGQGVVHYGPPELAIEMAARALKDIGINRYGPVSGLSPLIDAIEKKLVQENGFDSGCRSRIVVTAGSNMGFMNAILAIADPGDEIIIQRPYYFNHEMAIGIAGCRAVTVDTDHRFQLDFDKIQAAITPRTRAIVTISPNNPTGAVYPESALRAVNTLCGERGIYHIHDEAYEYFVYDGASHISPGKIPGSEPFTISLFSLSKSYGFAGWRIGYMAVPNHLLEAIKKIQDTNLICAPLISQHAAIGALEAGAEFVRGRLIPIADVRESARALLAGLGDRVAVSHSDGAFYLLLRVQSKLDSMDVVSRLIRRHAVAVLPGATFGISEGCSIRVAYAGLEGGMIREGLRRLSEGLDSLSEWR